MKIKQKLITGFLGVALIVILAGAAGIFISRAIGKSADVILEEKSPLKDISMETGLVGMPIPLHPGAEKYFKEKGVLK